MNVKPNQKLGNIVGRKDGHLQSDSIVVTAATTIFRPKCTNLWKILYMQPNFISNFYLPSRFVSKFRVFK